MKLTILLAFLLNNAFALPQPFMAWKEAFNQNGIKISYDIYPCNGSSMLFWKIENTTGQNKLIHVNGAIVEGNNTQKINFSIQASTKTIEGNCSGAIDPASPCLSLMHSFTNPNISITVN